MLKKFNKFMWISICVSTAFLIFGLLLLFLPVISFQIISYLIAITLIVCGIILIADYNGSLLLLNFLPTGILSLILGIIIVLYPNALAIIIPIVIGIWLIVNSLVNLELSWNLKKTGYNNWLLSLILSSILIICGILIMINPEISSIAFTTLLGVILIVYSITDIINIIIIKDKVNELVKILK